MLQFRLIKKRISYHPCVPWKLELLDIGKRKCPFWQRIVSHLALREVDARSAEVRATVECPIYGIAAKKLAFLMQC